MPINSFENYPMSWKTVIDRSKPHLPQQLAEQMKQDIQDGKLLPGTNLPPQRELADYLDVNLSTITRAYRICSQQGLITATTGRGTFVAYDVVTRIGMSASASPQEMIDMGVVMPEKISQTEMRALLAEMLSEEDFSRHFSYSFHADLWQIDAAKNLLNQYGYPGSKKTCFLQLEHRMRLLRFYPAYSATAIVSGSIR
jgi:DNA-binding transcriptional regulator YhcF (GntR family)